MRYLSPKSFATRILYLFLVPVLLLGIISSPLTYQASAYTYTDVKDLQNQIDALRAKENELAQRAATIAAETAGFEREKRNLENQISIIENQIALLEVEIQELSGQIAVQERKIANTQAAISETLVDMYLIEDVSLIEKLASSRSFASFIDDSIKYSSATDSLSIAVSTIKEAKAELEHQKSELAAKRDNQAAQKRDLNARRQELQRAINGNNAEQAQFAAEKASTAQQRKELSAKQSAIMWELAKDSIGGNISGNKGGYPYQGDCPRRQDDYLDRWGMYVCECVSYGAWKVEQYYGIKVKSIGRSGSYNGAYWPQRLKGIVPMGSEPRAGSIASWPDGPYGHVAWVEYIDGAGNVWVSEYNVKRGDYSERNASKTSGWLNANKATYIYFNQY